MTATDFAEMAMQALANGRQTLAIALLDIALAIQSGRM